jgi:hypothetical protein
MLHIAVSAAILALPGSLAWAVDAGRRKAASIVHQPGSVISSEVYDAPLDSVSSPTLNTLLQAADSYDQLQSDNTFVAPSKPFLQLGYGYLPLVWSSILAYYMNPLPTESGHFLEIAEVSFGFNMEWLPIWPLEPAIVQFMQSPIMYLGMASSLIYYQGEL